MHTRGCGATLGGSDCSGTFKQLSVQTAVDPRFWSGVTGHNPDSLRIEVWKNGKFLPL
jgi:hypothetical protein